MRRIIIFLIVVLMCIPSVYARKKKKKDLSGKISDNVFIDKKYDYQLSIPDTWKAEVKKNKDNLRLSLIQKDALIPDEFNGNPLNSLVPVANIYVTEMPCSPEKLIDSLLSDSCKSALKKKIMAEVKISDDRLQFQWLRKIQKKSIKLNDLPAVLWDGKANYDCKFGYSRHSREYGVTIICVRKDDVSLIFAMLCEELFARELSHELLAIVETLEW